jgi:hypothetical protein
LPADIGPWFTYAEARQMPEWRNGGRTAFFKSPSVLYFHSSMGGIGLTKTELNLALAALALTLIAFRRAIPLTAWVMLLTGATMWALAHATLFKLYLPSRYLSYVRPVFAMMWAAGVTREIVLWQARGGLRWRPRVSAGAEAFTSIPPSRSIRWAIGTLAAVVVVGYATLGVVRWRAAMTGRPWDVPAGYDAALAELAKLPVDTVVAAHPDDANAIPLRARRSVLTNTEVSVAFNKVYYAEQKRRIEATFDMLYATDWATIDAVADRYGVSVFLLDIRRLWHARDPGFRYFQPFQAENEQRIATGLARDFAMLDPPYDRVLRWDGDTLLIRVGSKR